ncbi:MAG: HD domain-containing protein [Chthonomonas sp.]|nr:HD domain-containing protein [Chthonomonas sp.]
MDLSSILHATQRDAVQALLGALDIHVPGEADHAQRVAVYAVATAHALGLDESELADIRRGAMLHDIGKIQVDREILTKLGELTDEDFKVIKAHSHLAETMLEELPWMVPALAMIRHHHERWDGQGYPDGLQGERIPLGARIIAVAEAFDQMTQESGWRDPISAGEALAEIHRNAGKQFDPDVVEAFGKVQPIIQPVSLHRDGI